jgi:hypothetical protein
VSVNVTLLLINAKNLLRKKTQSVCFPLNVGSGVSGNMTDAVFIGISSVFVVTMNGFRNRLIGKIAHLRVENIDSTYESCQLVSLQQCHQFGYGVFMVCDI